MIYFKADIRNATAATDDALTTSSVGIPVSLALASDFDGLAKTMVFKAGEVAVDIVLVGDADSTTVPPDVLTVKGKYLSIGIYAADGNGTIVIPTVWAVAGLIQEGTVPSGVDPAEPTPSWVAQVQNAASEALENSEMAVLTANESKEAAITARDSAQASAEASDLSARAAANSESNAASSQQAAAQSAENALDSEREAYASAERAEQAANYAGYLDVEIVDGRLVYTRTDAVDVDFELMDGHLIMEVV